MAECVKYQELFLLYHHCISLAREFLRVILPHFTLLVLQKCTLKMENYDQLLPLLPDLCLNVSFLE